MKRLTRRRSAAASPSAAAESAPAPAQPGAPGDAARALVEPAAAETTPLYDSDAVIDCVVAYNKYGGYVVPRQASHRVAAKAVIEGGVYEPQTIELIRAECGEHDVVHAGTFFGDFLPGVSSGLAPGARVYAFEPNPESYRCAAMTVVLNDLDNVELVGAGLGAQPSRADLLLTQPDGTYRGGSSRFLKASDPPMDGTTVEVPITTVDAMVPADRQVSVLQLDLEGYEQPALDGAMETIRRCRPLIVLESLPEADWIAAHLRPLGYRRAGRVHYNTVFRPSAPPD